MTEPTLSVELEGQQALLRLRKSDDASCVVEKALNQRSRPGLVSDLSRDDLNCLKQTVGPVNVILNTPQQAS